MSPQQVREALATAFDTGRMGVVAAMSRVGERKLRDFYNEVGELTPDELLSVAEVL